MICGTCKYSTKFLIINPVTGHRQEGHCSCVLNKAPSLFTDGWKCEFYEKEELKL